MKKQLLVFFVACAAVGFMVFQKYCNNPQNELVDKLDQVFLGARPNLEFSSTLLPLFTISNEISEMQLNMETDWEIAKVTVTQLNNEVSQLVPTDQRAAKQLQKSLVMLANRMNRNVEQARVDKAAWEAEKAKWSYIIWGRETNLTRDVEGKANDYNKTITAILQDNKAIQEALTNYGRTVAREVGTQVAKIDISDVEGDESREAFEDFSQKIDQTIAAGSDSGVGAEEETGQAMQSIFGQGLTPETLQHKFEARGREKH